MRLPFSTFILSATALFPLLPPSVLSIHPYASSRRGHALSSSAHILSSRQHHITRDLLDVCVNANVDLAANASQLLGLGSLIGDLGLGSNIHLCLCLKDLDLYLGTNDDVQPLVGLLGKNAASSVITALINTFPNSRQCTFPSNAHHTCSNSDPCHYECDTNYVKNGDTCVCAPPNISCNGVCGSFPQGCGSAVPSKKREEPVYTLSQAQARCKPHETVCGIPGQIGALAFECVDVEASEDSCGGCVTKHPFVDYSTQITGKDCTGISNVKSSSCFDRQCIVNSCTEGFLPNPTKDSCIPSPGSLTRMRRVRKRASPPSDNNSTTVNVSPDLLTQILAISSAVMDLSSLASSSSGFSSSSALGTTSTIYVLYDDIVRATGQLVTSATVSNLVSNTANLLDTCALLSSILSSCGCSQTLGLIDSADVLQDLITSVSALRTRCSSMTILASSSNSTSVAPINPPDQVIDLGLSSLLSNLSLLGNTDATSNLLSSIGLNSSHVQDSVVGTTSSNLVWQIIAVVNPVIKLRQDASSPAGVTVSPSIPDLVAASYKLLNSIISATTSLVNAETVSSLAKTTDALIYACEVASYSLGQNGLGYLVEDVEAISLSALELKAFCQDHPVAAPPSATSTSSAYVQSSTSILSSSASPSGVSDDTPIVLGLSDLLSELQLLGPVEANATVGGLGSGFSSTVNNLLNGLNIGPNNARRHDVSVTANSTINSELQSQMEGLFDLVLALEDSMSSLPSQDSETSLDDQSVLRVAHAMGQLLQSQTTAALLVNIDVFIDATSRLQEEFTECECTQTLDLDQAAKLLGLVADAAAGLKKWCASNFIVAPSPADPTPTSLGPLLPTGGPVAHPSPQAAPAPVFSPTTNSGDVPIVVGLDHLLDSLGLPGSTGVATVDGLGGGLDSALNNALDNVAGIGPGGVRRRQDTIMANEKVPARPVHGKRQVTASIYAATDSELSSEIEALVDLVLGLKDAADSLPSPPPYLTTALPSHPTTLPSSGLRVTGVPSVPLPVLTVSSSTSDIDSRLVDEILNVTIALLSCQTYEELVSESGALVSQSILSLEALETCNCTQVLGLGGVYDYLVNVLHASLELQDLIQAHPVLAGGSPSETPTSSPATTGSSASVSGREPLIVGLTKLLRGLGFNMTTNVVVDGLLGDGLDHSLNSLLDGLGIGPNGARKRSGIE